MRPELLAALLEKARSDNLSPLEVVKTFEAAASLPRQQQQLVEQFVSALLAQHRGRAA